MWLNSSVYALPQARMCDRWARITPDGFLFNVKCHRLRSRHATKADALPTDLRAEAEMTDRGNVRVEWPRGFVRVLTLE